MRLFLFLSVASAVPTSLRWAQTSTTVLITIDQHTLCADHAASAEAVRTLAVSAQCSGTAEEQPALTELFTLRLQGRVRRRLKLVQRAEGVEITLTKESGVVWSRLTSTAPPADVIVRLDSRHGSDDDVEEDGEAEGPVPSMGSLTQSINGKTRLKDPSDMSKREHLIVSSFTEIEDAEKAGRRPKLALLNRLKALTQEAPLDHRAHALLGNGLTVAGRPAEAVASLQTAVRLAPDNKGWNQMLGNALISSGESGKEAIDAFKAGLKLTPNEPDAYHGLGVAYATADAKAVAEALRRAQVGRAQPSLKRTAKDRASEQFRRALELKPGDPRVYSALAIHLGRTRMRTAPDAQLAATRKAAIKTAEHAIGLRPADTGAYIALGAAILGVDERARAPCATAPDDQRRADCLTSKQAAKASRTLDRAVKMVRDGLAQVEMGQLADALSLLGRALDTHRGREAEVLDTWAAVKALRGRGVRPSLESWKLDTAREEELRRLSGQLPGADQTEGFAIDPYASASAYDTDSYPRGSLGHGGGAAKASWADDFARRRGFKTAWEQMEL
jgi:Flp pilus assembly protein TadD